MRHQEISFLNKHGHVRHTPCQQCPDNPGPCADYGTRTAFRPRTGADDGTFIGGFPVKVSALFRHRVPPPAHPLTLFSWPCKSVGVGSPRRQVGNHLFLIPHTAFAPCISYAGIRVPAYAHDRPSNRVGRPENRSVNSSARDQEITMKKITVRKAGTVRLTSAAASAYCCGASA